MTNYKQVVFSATNRYVDMFLGTEKSLSEIRPLQSSRSSNEGKNDDASFAALEFVHRRDFHVGNIRKMLSVSTEKFSNLLRLFQIKCDYSDLLRWNAGSSERFDGAVNKTNILL